MGFQKQVRRDMRTPEEVANAAYVSINASASRGEINALHGFLSDIEKIDFRSLGKSQEEVNLIKSGAEKILWSLTTAGY